MGSLQCTLYYRTHGVNGYCRDRRKSNFFIHEYSNKLDEWIIGAQTLINRLCSCHFKNKSILWIVHHKRSSSSVEILGSSNICQSSKLSLWQEICTSHRFTEASTNQIHEMHVQPSGFTSPNPGKFVQTVKVTWSL